MVKKALIAILAVFLIVTSGGALDDAAAAQNGPELYAKYCASCHHEKRLGLTAPPLIPGLFSKRNAKRLEKVISDGLPATQMPPFNEKLAADEIASIATFIKTPVENPDWTFADINKSRRTPEGQKARKHSARLNNVTLVMERGKKSLAVLDGDTLEELTKFYVGNVHGGPKFSYDLKKIYSASRDGIVTKFDIPSLTAEMRLKAGIYTRTVAVSFNGSVVAVANQLPNNIVFFNERMEPVHEIKTPDKIGGFYTLPKLRAFVASFREKPELWIIDDHPPFAMEKHSLPAPFEDFSISPVGNFIMGTKRGSDRLYIYDYADNKILAEIPTSGLPHLASAAFWQRGGELMAAVNHIKEPKATIYSLDKLKVETEINLPAPGFFVRTHFATPYLWVDTMTEDIILIDKKDLNNRLVIKPRKGKKSMHVEFTREGRYALVTVMGRGGEVVVYDAKTLRKIKTIPYEVPVGKYNATNKTYPAYALGNMERKNTQARLQGNGEKGEKVFRNYCMGCHHQIFEAFGPSFTDIAEKRIEAEIRAHILAPKESAGDLGYNKSSMSHVALSEREIDAIVEYIMSFGKKGDN